jgi:hypothetical protein
MHNFLCNLLQNFALEQPQGRMGMPQSRAANSNIKSRLRVLPQRMDAWYTTCTQPPVGFPTPVQIFRSVDSPEEQKSTLSASRAALRCNRIQLDAEEAGPTSPVFFL